MPTDNAPRAEGAPASEKTNSPHYRAARDAFDKLEAAEKAAFLLESAFGSAGELVAEAARAVGDVVERAGQSDFWRTPASEEDGGAGTESPRPRRKAPPAGDPGAQA